MIPSVYTKNKPDLAFKTTTYAERQNKKDTSDAKNYKRMNDILLKTNAQILANKFQMTTNLFSISSSSDYTLQQVIGKISTILWELYGTLYASDLRNRVQVSLIVDYLRRESVKARNGKHDKLAESLDRIISELNKLQPTEEITLVELFRKAAFLSPQFLSFVLGANIDPQEFERARQQYGGFPRNRPDDEQMDDLRNAGFDAELSLAMVQAENLRSAISNMLDSEFDEMELRGLYDENLRRERENVNDFAFMDDPMNFQMIFPRSEQGRVSIGSEYANFPRSEKGRVSIGSEYANFPRSEQGRVSIGSEYGSTISAPALYRGTPQIQRGTPRELYEYEPSKHGSLSSASQVSRESTISAPVLYRGMPQIQRGTPRELYEYEPSKHGSLSSASQVSRESQSSRIAQPSPQPPTETGVQPSEVPTTGAVGALQGGIEKERGDLFVGMDKYRELLKALKKKYGIKVSETKQGMINILATKFLEDSKGDEKSIKYLTLFHKPATKHTEGEFMRKDKTGKEIKVQPMDIKFLKSGDLLTYADMFDETAPDFEFKKGYDENMYEQILANYPTIRQAYNSKKGRGLYIENSYNIIPSSDKTIYSYTPNVPMVGGVPVQQSTQPSLTGELTQPQLYVYLQDWANRLKDYIMYSKSSVGGKMSDTELINTLMNLMKGETRKIEPKDYAEIIKQYKNLMALPEGTTRTVEQNLIQGATQPDTLNVYEQMTNMIEFLYSYKGLKLFYGGKYRPYTDVLFDTCQILNIPKKNTNRWQDLFDQDIGAIPFSYLDGTTQYNTTIFNKFGIQKITYNNSISVERIIKTLQDKYQSHLSDDFDPVRVRQLLDGMEADGVNFSTQDVSQIINDIWFKYLRGMINLSDFFKANIGDANLTNGKRFREFGINVIGSNESAFKDAIQAKIRSKISQKQINVDYKGLADMASLLAKNTYNDKIRFMDTGIVNDPRYKLMDDEQKARLKKLYDDLVKQYLFEGYTANTRQALQDYEDWMNQHEYQITKEVDPNTPNIDEGMQKDIENIRKTRQVEGSGIKRVGCGIKVFRSQKQMIDRMKAIMDSIKMKNDNKDIRNEFQQICDILLSQKKLSLKDYKQLNRTYGNGNI